MSRPAVMPRMGYSERVPSGDDGLSGLGLEVLHRHDEGVEEVRVGRAARRPALVQVQAQAEAAPFLAVRGHRHVQEQPLLGHLEESAHALQRVIIVRRVIQLGRGKPEGVPHTACPARTRRRGRRTPLTPACRFLRSAWKTASEGRYSSRWRTCRLNRPTGSRRREAGLEAQNEPPAPIHQAHHLGAHRRDGQHAQVALGAEAAGHAVGSGASAQLHAPGQHHRLGHLLRRQRLDQRHRWQRPQQEVEEGWRTGAARWSAGCARGQPRLHREEGHGLDEAPHVRILPVQRHRGVRGPGSC